LTGVAHHRGDAGRDVLRKRLIIENDVRAFAAELLCDAFDARGRVLRDLDASAGRAGERDHVDVGMAGHRDAGARTIALNQVEHAGGNACYVQDLGEDLRGVRRDLGWLEDHRAAGRERREDLHRDLIHRPVPRRDQTAHADRLFDDQRRTALFFEAKRLEQLDRSRQVPESEPDLIAVRGRCRRAHLFGDRSREIRRALLIFRRDALQQLEPVFAIRLRPSRKSFARGFHRAVYVGRGTERDLTGHHFSRRVHDIQRPRLDWIDPSTVDVQLQVSAHDYCCPSAYQVRNSS
jgi:hypothetical protein